VIRVRVMTVKTQLLGAAAPFGFAQGKHFSAAVT